MLLKFAIKDFLEDRELKSLSPYTLAGYKRTLDEFYQFCIDKEIINIEDVTTNTIKSYLIFCQKERKNNARTLNHKFFNLRIFFNYMEEIEVIAQKKAPTRKLSPVKEAVKIQVFTDEQVRQMLKYYQRMKYRDKTYFAYRDYTIIVTLVGTGIRLGELCNLKWTEIDMVNNTITVWGKKRQQSSIPMTDKLKKELCEYQVFCKQTDQLGEYVFVNDKKNRMTENAIKCVFKRLKKIMNFSDARVSAHTFRHYVAVKMIRQGCDVFTVQRILRHTDIKMTMRYVNLFGTALAEQNNKYNPLNSIDT